MLRWHAWCTCRGPDAPSKKVERATAQQAAKREQMAAAAEARMAALKAAASQQQLWSVPHLAILFALVLWQLLIF